MNSIQSVTSETQHSGRGVGREVNQSGRAQSSFPPDNTVCSRTVVFEGVEPEHIVSHLRSALPLEIITPSETTSSPFVLQEESSGTNSCSAPEDAVDIWKTFSDFHSHAFQIIWDYTGRERD